MIIPTAQSPVPDPDRPAILYVEDEVLLRAAVADDMPVMERVLDDVSFSAPDQPPGYTVVIDGKFVDTHVGDLAKNADLSKFIL